METPPPFDIFGGSSDPHNSADHPPHHRGAGGPAAGPAAAGASNPCRSTPTVPVAVRDLASLLVDAYQTDRAWLRDFGHESIHVSADLYDVLLAYRQLLSRRAA
jgi:hypothetical protein